MPRIISTVQAIKLLESRKVSIIISTVGGNWEWIIGETIGADEHSIKGGKIGIMCVSLETCILSN